MTFQPPNPPPKYLKVTEVAERINEKENKVRRLCRGGELPGAFREKRGSPWKIPPSAVDAYLQRNPPGNQWQRIRATSTWQRMLAALGLIGVLLTTVNTVTGFFSNIFGAAPVIPFVCRQPLIKNFCSSTPTSPPIIATMTSVTNTATPTPTPLPIQPAMAGETLILIATFHGEIANRDEPHVLIKEAIETEVIRLRTENNLLDDLHLRVAIHPQELTGGEEAQPLVVSFARPYSATIVIWGDVTGTRVRVNFLNLRQPTFDAAQAKVEERERTFVANPKAYNRFVNDDLPRQISFLTLFAIGQSFYAREDYESVARTIEQAVVTTKGIEIRGLAEAYFHLGYLYQEPLNHLGKAIQNYNQAIKLNPQYAAAYVNRGTTRGRQGDLAGAIADFEQVIKVDPMFAAAYIGRGNARFVQGNRTDAIADYNRAIELDPSFTIAYIRRGNIRADLGDLIGAISDYTQAIALTPDSAYIYYNRGTTLHEKGDILGAIADYNQVIKLDPGNANAYINRGIVRNQQGNFVGALSDYNQAIRLNPQNGTAYNNRGITRYNQGDFAGALADYNQAIKLDPKDATAYNNRGLALVSNGNLSDALLDYSQAIELDPENAKIFRNRGVARQTQGDMIGAISDYNQAITLDPTLVTVYINRGSIAEVQGNWQNAITDYNQAIQIDPSFVEAYKLRGMLNHQLGELEKSQTDFQKFLELSSTNEPMRSQITQWLVEIEAILAKR
jgi:tetratricopeptide (TPR) repeat protein